MKQSTEVWISMCFYLVCVCVSIAGTVSLYSYVKKDNAQHHACKQACVKDCGVKEHFFCGEFCTSMKYQWSEGTECK